MTEAEAKAAVNFQSYLSPIQTRRGRCCTSPDRRSFNPTLVQFKLPDRVRRTDALHPFNPTLVQFKLCRCLSWMPAGASFNPTLVQFKPCIADQRRGKFLGFQSYLSPIQTSAKRNHAFLRTSFNPTLVQFKRSRRAAALLLPALSILP